MLQFFRRPRFATASAAQFRQVVVGGGGLVLIVEDDDDIREALADAVVAAGCQSKTTRHGADALHWMKESGLRPCLIILDLMMPVMDGWNFRQMQVSEPELADIPVVVLSASDDVPRGVRTYLQKPVDIERLLSLVRSLCGCAGRVAG